MTFCFALLVGLELALAWGAIFFVLNYVPFLGPLVAVVLATLFAAAQFESWQMALINLAGLSVIQFLIGSYLEPLLAGATLAISPFLVLFAVFFWSFLWGIPGAFIGVPLTIAFLTICEQCVQLLDSDAHVGFAGAERISDGGTLPPCGGAARGDRGIVIQRAA